MKNRLYRGLQKISKALMIPVRLLPVIGLLLAVSNLFTHTAIAELLPEDSVLLSFFAFLSQALISLIPYFGLFFTIGIAAGLADKYKVEAGFSAMLAYFASLFMLQSTSSISIGHAIILGLLTGFLHNRFSEAKFPSFFQIYGGTRFVLVLLLPIAILLSLVFNWLGPFIQNSSAAMSEFIQQSGNFGLFLYGALERLTIPSGLQHLVTTPLLYTSLGGAEEVGGAVFAGARNIYFAEMANPAVPVLSESVIWDARGISKMFGLVGASLAMYHTANPEQKRQAKTTLLPAALTSFMSGVTEPIEFLFMFSAPKLFAVHAAMSGLSMVVLNLLDVRTIAPTGFMDFLSYNLPLGVEKTRWPLFILIGLLFFVLYYVVFRFAITKFNLQVLDETEPQPVYEMTTTPKADDRHASTIVEALGGADNIQTLTSCYSRLRLTVEDPQKVNEAVLKEDTGATGVMINENNVHVVYGLEVGKIQQAVEKQLGRDAEEDE